MKRGRALVVLVGVVFCVAIVIFYRCLERLQPIREQDSLLPWQHPNAGEQLFQLQLKMEHLETLLRDNNRLVSELGQSLKASRSKASWDQRGGANTGGGANAGPPQGCRLDEEQRGGAEVQMLDVYDVLPFDNPDGGAWKQGFPIRYRGDEWNTTALEVYLVPHSHNDPGWIKTFDQYYHDQTRHILDNMLHFLSQDSRRKMIWAEVSYFSKWWNDLDAQKRDMVKKLVGAGQLEMVTGGWVMADEANSHYFALLDQLMEGHQWIQKNLGVKPTNGWAIDPFGHSPSMSYLLKGAGLQNHVIQRVHYSVKKHFSQQRLLEFSWRQAWGPSSSGNDITCHMMPFYSYDIPHTCGPNPSVCCQFDFHRLPGGRVYCPWRIPPKAITPDNVQERALLLLDQYRQKSRLFRTPVLLVPLGDDFRFTETSEWENQLQNYQALFEYMNKQPDLHVKAQFGTLADYFRALHRHLDSTQEKLPVVGGDFFTYADRDDHYWSGYFTSRPFYKRLDRSLESTLRSAEILFSMAMAEARHYHGDGQVFPGAELFGHLTTGRRSLGLFQHHDAVTGTAKDPVVQDYGLRLLRAILNLRKVIQSSAHFLLLSDKNQFHQSQPFLQSDEFISAHDVLPQKTTIKLSDKPRLVVVYNSLARRRSTVVTVAVDTPDARVMEAETGRPITAQISAVWEGPTRASSNTFQLSFVAELAPLSLSLYHLSRAPSGSASRARYTYLNQEVHKIQAPDFSLSPGLNQDLTISNTHQELTASAQTGLLQKLRLSSGQVRQVQVQFLWYGTRTGTDKSGAYLFLPGEGGAQPYDWSEPPVVRVTQGPVFSDITSCFKHVTHSVRLFHIKGPEGKSVQLQNTVDIRSVVNKELVMRLVTDVSNGNRFYTDLNDLQMLQRRTLDKIPLQANFYPMTSAAFIQDQDQTGTKPELNQDQTRTRLTLLSAQSQAVAALKPGLLEVVLDRRLQQDDNRGLGQGVLDNKLTDSLYHLLMETQEVGVSSGPHLSLLAHLSSADVNHPPVTMVTPPDHAVQLRPFTAIGSSLPCDLHLLNLRTLESQQEAGSPSQEVALLLHRKGFGCSFTPDPAPQCTWSAHEKINISEVLAPLRLRSLRRSGLTLLRLDDEPESARQQEHYIIRLRPMEISAFRVELE